MTTQIYPEIIRGVWFCLKDGAEFQEAWQKQSFDIYLFWVNGEFIRMTLKDGNKREVETGQYTFDGNFLITRGRSTETFRVELEQTTHWRLQSKKHDLHFVRQLTQPVALDEADARDLRILPIRAGVEPVHKHLPRCFWLTYGTRDNQTTRLAMISTDEEQAEHGWVGATRLVEGLDPNAWSRLISEAFLSGDWIEQQWSGYTLGFVDEDQSLDVTLGS